MFISSGSGLNKTAGWYAELSVLTGISCGRATALKFSALSALCYMWLRDGSSKEKKKEKELSLLMPGGE